MGVWDFLKDAAREAPADPPAQTLARPSDAELKQALLALGLNLDGLVLLVEGDTVIVNGRAVDVETKEKVIVAAGNFRGIAHVQTDWDDDIRDAIFHTVGHGDTLATIARKTLGDASRDDEILEANRPMLSGPEGIYPGQVLRIPHP
jgi:nucleoid-associated protein YgaU